MKTNEYFIKQPYIPLEYLHQNVSKDKNLANGLQFVMHLKDTKKKTHKNLSSLKTYNTNSEEKEIESRYFLFWKKSFN